MVAACKCNLHAKKCRFNEDLFAKSGGVSGGVCQKCRHHTTGRFCNHCKPGYYKNNKTKSIAHRKICKCKLSFFLKCLIILIFYISFHIQ